MMPRTVVRLWALAFVACGSTANRVNQPPDSGTGGAPGHVTDGGREAAAAVDATATGDATHDGAATTDAGHDAPGRTGPPTAEALQGGWYADLPAPDGGFASTHRRRFVNGTYQETTVTPVLLCAEAGSYTVDGDGVHFSPSEAVGPGCALGAARVEPVAWAADGIAFGPMGSSVIYRAVRNVPKLFPTPEAHDGNFAGDTALPGATAIAKADALCNSSLGKPDAQTYKALLVDGVNRGASPAVDWVLRPGTTYFRPDGTLNLFHTDGMGLTDPDANNAVEPNGDFSLWSGLNFDFTVRGPLTCQGWSSAASADLGVVAAASSAGATFTSSGADACNVRNPIWCVSQ